MALWPFVVAASPSSFCVSAHKIDDKSVAGGRAGEGDGSVPPPLTMAELFDEDRLEMMGCRLADYDPARLAADGGEWLEEYPNPSLSPKAVRGARCCLLKMGGAKRRGILLFVLRLLGCTESSDTVHFMSDSASWPTL